MYIIIPVNAFDKTVLLHQVVHAKDEYEASRQVTKLVGLDISNDVELREVCPDRQVPSYGLPEWLDRYNRYIERRGFGVRVHMVSMEVTL